MTCCECKKEVETLRGAAYEITAFVEIRSHEIHWKEKTGRTMCHECVQIKKVGIDPRQMSLA